MPLVHAYIADNPSSEQKTAFMRAVTEAACRHLGVAEKSVRVWITPIPEDGFMAAGVSLAERRAAERAGTASTGGTAP